VEPGNIEENERSLLLGGRHKAIEELGGKQMQLDAMHGLQCEAEANGCLVSILLVPVSSCRCLARTWKAHECPVVPSSEWTMAVEQVDL
jgi:hypothetical protein